MLLLLPLLLLVLRLMVFFPLHFGWIRFDSNLSLKPFEQQLGGGEVDWFEWERGDEGENDNSLLRLYTISLLSLFVLLWCTV